MACFSAREALDEIMQSESEKGTSSSTEDSEISSVSTSEVDPGPAEESSRDSASEMEEAAEQAWASKVGRILWSPMNGETLQYVPAATGLVPGPTTIAVAHITDPLSSFGLLLTDGILEHIVAMTNLHGRRSAGEWRDLDGVELQAYVGLFILTGEYRSRGKSILSLWNEKTGRTIFKATMSHKRFHQICRALPFDDKLTRPRRSSEDKLAAFRQVWDMWTQQLLMSFNPDRDICVDEQLVPFRGRCKFRQYMPKKPAKYGLKIWVTCDAKTSYTWKLQVFTGKTASTPEINQGKQVVLELTEGLQGHTVTCDNFFTSFGLAEELLKKKLSLVGTIQRNKPELPLQLLQTKGRAMHSSTFTFTRTHTVVSYIPRQSRNVLLLSTKHRALHVNEEPKRKPVIVQDYNRCKGGVDNLDKVVSMYSCRRRVNQWPLALFHNLLDISLYNALILWTAVEPAWKWQKSHRRRLFIEEVREGLVTPNIIGECTAPAQQPLQLSDLKWIMDLAFLVDMLCHLDRLNLTLQASGQVTSAALNKQRARYATLVENLHESFVTRFRDLQLKRPQITFLVDPFNAETDCLKAPLVTDEAAAESEMTDLCEEDQLKPALREGTIEFWKRDRGLQRGSPGRAPRWHLSCEGETDVAEGERAPFCGCEMDVGEEKEPLSMGFPYRH
uniref:LOW QUALITY PROTEIN: piggyBac transposable element-derived protein 4-like n=1 Tax=Monopterus albus TaxID=43700 RepID=UPI0009B46D6C|nr:LOW QUALITY PROTEIN: piggyBac transposable element-derived protein 4-like [Monopterus albus]